MPPKRRKAEDPASQTGPPPPKRVTRSSAKPNPAIQASTSQTDVPKPATKTTKPAAPKKPKGPSKAKPKAAAKQEKKSTSDSKDAEAPPLEALSYITYADLKNPIPCQSYIPSTPTLSTSSSPTPTLIFTHGAGGTLSADAVVNFCTGYSTSSPVLTFQGSMNLNARVKGFHACIEHLSKEGKITDRRYVLGGRSMGARAAVIAASEILSSDDEDADEKTSLGQKDVSVILVSYPLQGPKGDLRDQILLELPATVRVLFVIGDKDSMCPLDALNEVRTNMQAKNELIVVRGADHGMHVRPAGLERELGREGGQLAAAWVRGEMTETELNIGSPK